MPQILVRDLDEKIVARLKKRARRDGRSLQSEVKSILERAAIEESDPRKIISMVDSKRGWGTLSISLICLGMSNLILESRRRFYPVFFPATRTPIIFLCFLEKLFGLYTLQYGLSLL